MSAPDRIDMRPAATAAYDAGDMLGEFHDAMDRRLGLMHWELDSDRVRMERVCRAFSVSAGYAALALGVAGVIGGFLAM